MAVTYTDYQEIINQALHSLLIDEFATIGVRFFPEFEENELARKGEYIRWFADGDDFESGLSNGETRKYNYTIVYYIDNHHKYVKKFYEQTISDRAERLNKLLIQNPTYEVSSAYKWHNMVIESRTKPTRLSDEQEDVRDSIYFVEMSVSLMRTNTW